MSGADKVVKFTISMDPDLRDWIDEKVEELNRKDRRLKSSRSAIIADAVQQMRDLEVDALGKVKPQIESANVIRPFGNSAGGSLTPKPVTYRKAGKAK